MWRRVRRKHVLPLVVALAGGVALYWLLSDRLTEEERQLVGVWTRKVTLKSPDDTLHVMQLNDDRSCRWAIFDASTVQPCCQALEGRWSLQSGELVIDYEPRTLHRLSRSVSALRSRFRPLNTESLTVESAERDTLRLQTRGRPPETQVYTRSAERVEIPPSLSPQDLGH